MSIATPPRSDPGTFVTPTAKRPVSAGLTLRAVTIGCVFTILLTIWSLHSEFVTRGSYITVTHLPVAALLPFLLMVLLVNPCLKFTGYGRPFSPQELIVIFFLVFTASAIPGWAFSNYAISIVSGPFYYANPENRWADLFLDYLPSWLVVRDSMGGLNQFWEGATTGRSIRWQMWFVPMFWWVTFYIALFLVGASIMVILRKQWVEHERLTFPLAQVPLALVDGAEDRALWPRIARVRLFWWGFGITLFIMSWNMISFFDLFSPIPLGAGHAFPLTLYEAFHPIQIRLNFLLIVVAYFTRVEVLLSVWLFYLIRIVQQGVMTRVGVPGPLEMIHFQHLSGFFVFVLFGLWMARRHIRDVLRKAFGRAPEIDDSREFFSYRTAVLSFAGGSIYMVFLLWSAGMALWVVMLMMFVLLILYMGVTRVVAETGLASLDLPYNSANEITFRFVGSEHIDARTITGMWLCQTFTRNWRTLGMCSMAHAAKVGDDMGGVGRGVFGAIALSLGIGFMTALVYTLYLGYDMGASQLTAGGFESGARGYWAQLETFLTNPEAMTRSQLTMVLSGVLISGFLIWAHHRLHFWPLHPVGFGIVTTYAADMAFFSILIAWIVKTVVLSLGGVSLYRKGQPFFIGILAGYAVGVFLTFLLDAVWFPGSGHVVDGW